MDTMLRSRNGFRHGVPLVIDVSCMINGWLSSYPKNQNLNIFLERITLTQFAETLTVWRSTRSSKFTIFIQIFLLTKYNSFIMNDIAKQSLELPISNFE